MGKFVRAGDERVNVFEIDGVYFFKHYFDADEIFDRLKQYYNTYQYRFEIPEADFPELNSFFEGHGYGLVVVENPREFAVAVRKYTVHPENIFKESVIQRSVDEYNCFLIRDQASVERTVSEGAIRLSATDLANPFESVERG